jgi:hypothetical protein
MIKKKREQDQFLTLRMDKTYEIFMVMINYFLPKTLLWEYKLYEIIYIKRHKTPSWETMTHLVMGTEAVVSIHMTCQTPVRNNAGVKWGHHASPPGRRPVQWACPSLNTIVSMQSGHVGVSSVHRWEARSPRKPAAWKAWLTAVVWCDNNSTYLWNSYHVPDTAPGTWHNLI